MFRGALRLLLAAALCAAPAFARADVYKWVDADGLTHYATSRADVPSDYRDSAEVIVPPPVGVPNPSSARPPAPPAPPPAPAPAAVEPAPAQAAPALAPGTPTPPVDAAPPGANEAPAPPAPAPAAGPGESAAPPAERAPVASIDPRQQEIAQIEAAIERDREELRNLISTQRWDASELASDPHVREIAERLPRLQAELAALRSEAEH